MSRKIKFVKETPRLNVKFVQASSGKVLFEIKDRDWMNVGELFTDHYVTELMRQTYDAEYLSKIGKIIVVVAADYQQVIT